MMDDATLLSDARRRLPAARSALARAIGDMPASGAHSGSSGVSDRTFRLACREVKTGKTGPDGEELMRFVGFNDEAIMDSRRLDATEKLAIKRLQAGLPITDQLERIIDICDRWAPTERRRRALDANLRAAAEGRGDDGCISHARVHDHKGVSRYEERHPGLPVCQSCHRDLRRVRARDRYNDAVMVPIVVVKWRERHPGKNLSDATLDRLLAGVDA